MTKPSSRPRQRPEARGWIAAVLSGWLPFAGAILPLAHSASVSALSTDKDQPIEIEADSAELDDVKNISIYRGNVVVVRGSIRMTGDVMTVYYTPDDKLSDLIMDGKPATYRQLPDNSQVYDEAEALRMEYHEQKNLIILIKKAMVKQERVTFSGDRVEYDTRLSQVKAWSKPGSESGKEAGTPKSSGRVKIIIKNKAKPKTPDGSK